MNEDYSVSVEPLSDCEYAVLRLIVEGRTDSEIAEALCISYGAVKEHMRQMSAKLAVSARMQEAVAALRTGLMD